MNKKINPLKMQILISFILLFIFALSSVLYVTLQPKEEKDIFEQYYKTKIELFKEENKNISSADIVFIGDSLTDGYDLKTYYPSLKVFNRGIGGDRTYGVLKRLDVSAFDLNPKVIVLLIGGNDILAGHSYSKIINNYEKILNNLKTHLPNTHIITQSMYPTGQNYANKNVKMIKLNTYIKQSSLKYNCTFVDMYSHLLDTATQELKTEYTIEGVHLTQIGYEKVTSVLSPIISDLLQ